MIPLDFSRVQFAVLHHSDHEPEPASTAYDEMQRIRGWHLERGFHDIGYHFVIKGNSWTYGRPLPHQGAHCFGFNHISFGFCVCGDFTQRLPTDSEVSCVVDVLRLVEGHIGRKLRIVGHNDLAKTLCPGPDLARMVRAEQHERFK